GLLEIRANTFPGMTSGSKAARRCCSNRRRAPLLKRARNLGRNGSLQRLTTANVAPKPRVKKHRQKEFQISRKNNPKKRRTNRRRTKEHETHGIRCCNVRL